MYVNESNSCDFPAMSILEGCVTRYSVVTVLHKPPIICMLYGSLMFGHVVSFLLDHVIVWNIAVVA